MNDGNNYSVRTRIVAGFTGCSGFNRIKLFTYRPSHLGLIFNIPVSFNPEYPVNLVNPGLTWGREF
jgi:hypothetical protein